ncbi:helix-turn-helix domain-containing protein [Nocardiopsis listeri]|uniref:helix-turn-helix domain-containing protein n=1 Tax=Nocardiopsis listeri TaxID=53440 RepID=UPI000AD438ED|nr:helix-turn-helix domain-containing protein [Nocardiopsis listeri]
MATIGQTLSAARIAAGCSLEHLSTRTRIRMQVLRAIENEDFVPCGGDFYARGHIRRICKFFELDAGPLLEEYDREHASDEKPLFVPPQWQPATKTKKRAARAAAARGDQGHAENGREGGEESQDVPRRVGDEDLDPTQRAESWGHFERNKKLARPPRPEGRSRRRAATVPPPRGSEEGRTEEGRTKEGHTEVAVTEDAATGATAEEPRARGNAARTLPIGGVRRHWPWAVVGLILVVALIVGVRTWNGWEEGDPARTAFENVTDDESGAEKNAGSVVVPEAETVGKALARGPEKVARPTEFTVRLTGVGRSWVEVTDHAGGDVFTGFIVEGESLDYVTEDPLSLRLGKPSLVGVSVDGEDLGERADSGGVGDFTVGADGFVD